METFTEEKDASAFYLLTRWTDAGLFRAWHASPAHHQSHRGIPKGLKLDPSFTEIFVLDRLSDGQLSTSLQENIPSGLGSAGIQSSNYVVVVPINARSSRPYWNRPRSYFRHERTFAGLHSFAAFAER